MVKDVVLFTLLFVFERVISGAKPLIFFRSLFFFFSGHELIIGYQMDFSSHCL